MIKKFMNYVEVQTKITSLFTFTFVLGVMLYHHVSIQWYPTVIFFLGMFLFDLTTTAINNYIDSKTNGQDLGFSRTAAKTILFSLLGLSIAFGLWLVILSDWLVLLLGMFCFGVGILYTYGPVPISRQPYGELVSGVLYGYFIPFILLYINLGDAMLRINLGAWTSIHVNVVYLGGFLLLGLIPTLLTSNIMLGNNTCDVEADVLVNRFTLPYYIGKPAAVVLMRTLYGIVYVAIIAGVVTGLYHPVLLLACITIIPVMKNVNAFKQKMIKRVSFINVIKNFVLILGSTTILVYISLLF